MAFLCRSDDGEQELRAKYFIVWILSAVPFGRIVLLVVLATENLNRTRLQGRGSEAGRWEGHVRFTPESGRVRCKRGCRLWANSGHRVCLRSLCGRRLASLPKADVPDRGR